jgi:hypothetical protein
MSMVLSEQERLLSVEKNLLNVATQYSYSSSSWGTIEDYGNVTTPAAGILFFNFEFTAGSGSSGKACLYVGGIPVELTTLTAVGSTIVGGAVWLPQGTYDIQIQGQCTGMIYVENLQVGYTLFNDCTSYALQSVTQGATINLTPATRQTPLGPLNETVFCINVSGEAPVNQLTTIQSITVDGTVYTTFDENTTMTGGLAASAKLFMPLAVGVQHSISAELGNASATMYVSIIACPWILTTAPKFHQPVKLQITQLSTIYAIVCPLFLDVVKEIFVGAPKGISSGPGSDYYGYASAGTGANVSFSFTFDSVNAALVTFSADSLGGCIDNIGVDVE